MEKSMGHMSTQVTWEKLRDTDKKKKKSPHLKKKKKNLQLVWYSLYYIRVCVLNMRWKGRFRCWGRLNNTPPKNIQFLISRTWEYSFKICGVSPNRMGSPNVGRRPAVPAVKRFTWGKTKKVEVSGIHSKGADRKRMTGQTAKETLLGASGWVCI